MAIIVIVKLYESINIIVGNKKMLKYFVHIYKIHKFSFLHCCCFKLFFSLPNRRRFIKMVKKHLSEEEKGMSKITKQQFQSQQNKNELFHHGWLKWIELYDVIYEGNFYSQIDKKFDVSGIIVRKIYIVMLKKLLLIRIRAYTYILTQHESMENIKLLLCCVHHEKEREMEKKRLR